MEKTLIIFGNGEETTSNKRAHIGDLEAIVCNDNQLTTNLVAIHPIVDAGYDIHLSSTGGTVNKPIGGPSFPVLRDGMKWMIDLEELKELKIGELLIGDIIGKIQPAPRDGDVFFHLFVDKRSGYMKAYMSKTKDSFVTALQDTIAHFENFGHKVKAFRSDSEKIMKWGPVKQLLKCKGIQPQHSLPYAHYQNLVERYVQTIMKAVSTVIHTQSLLKAHLWDYALFYVVNCRN
jgi:hypothetical protein